MNFSALQGIEPGFFDGLKERLSGAFNPNFVPLGVLPLYHIIKVNQLSLNCRPLICGLLSPGLATRMLYALCVFPVLCPSHNNECEPSLPQHSPKKSSVACRLSRIDRVGGGLLIFVKERERREREREREVDVTPRELVTGG